MPTYNNQIHSEVTRNLIDLSIELKERGVGFSIAMPSSPLLSLSRNLIMDAGLDSDWILMWDSDIQVPTAKFLQKMIDTAYKTDAAMVGLLVRLKIPDTQFACGMKEEGGYKRLTEAPKKPTEVDVMGAGVTLLNCKWIRDNLDQPYYQFVDVKGVNGPSITPEDWRLCEKIKEKGGKIVVEPNISTIHWGQASYMYENA